VEASLSEEIANVPSLIENTVNPKFEAVKNSLAYQSSRVQQEKERVNVLSQKVSGVPALIESTVNPKITEVKDSIHVLKTSINTEKGRIDTLNQEVGKVPDQIKAAIDPKVQEFTEKFKNLQSNIDTEKERIDQLNTDVGNVPAQIEAAINPKVQELTEKFTTLKSNIETEKGRIDQLTTDVGNVPAQIQAAINPKVQEFTEKYSTLQSNLDTEKERIDQLTTDVGNIPTDRETAIDTKIAEIKMTIPNKEDVEKLKEKKLVMYVKKQTPELIDDNNGKAIKFENAESSDEWIETSTVEVDRPYGRFKIKKSGIYKVEVMYWGQQKNFQAGDKVTINWQINGEPNTCSKGQMCVIHNAQWFLKEQWRYKTFEEDDIIRFYASKEVEIKYWIMAITYLGEEA